MGRGRASRTNKHNMKKILTPSRNSFQKNKKPQIISINSDRTVNPEVICLDSSKWNRKRNPQLIDLEDDDVTVLSTHTPHIQKKKRLKKNVQNDVFILDDDIFIDAPSNSTKESPHAANSCQIEDKLTMTKENSNFKCPESGSSANNDSVAFSDAISVEQSSDHKTQPLSQFSVCNFSAETALKKSPRNRLNSSLPRKTAEHSLVLASDQPLSNFTPYKRSFNLPESSEISSLKEGKTPNLPSGNSPCETPKKSVNDSTAGPSNVIKQIHTRNKRKSIKQTTTQETSNDIGNHRYPLRSRGQPAATLRKSLPKPLSKQNNRNKKSAVGKGKGNSQKLLSPTPSHSDHSLGTSKNLNDMLQNNSYNRQCKNQEKFQRKNRAPISPSVNDVTVIGTKSADFSDKTMETKTYKGSENKIIRKKESSSSALNFIPIPSASKEVENELIQIYQTNKNRKSMKTDFSSIKINVGGSQNKTIAQLTKIRERKRQRKDKKKRKQFLIKEAEKKKQEMELAKGKSQLNIFSLTKTSEKAKIHPEQTLNTSKNVRPSMEPKNPGHSTPFNERYRDWESEGSMMNFNDRSVCDFNWITLDACYTNSDDETRADANSTSCNLPVIAAASPTNYRRSRSKNSAGGSSLPSKNDSNSSSCKEILVDKEVMNSEKEIVVVDDSDKAIDVDDSLSLSSEESFSVDVGTNVFVPDGVSFKGQRPIIIDGSNVAFGHGISTRGLRVFSSRGIEICAKYFLKRGHKVIVFVPLFRRWSTQTLNPEILQKMSDRGLITYTPSRKIKSKLTVPYDDRYIVQCAVALGGVIVSTDNYRDLLRENPTWKSTIEKRLLMFTFVGDMLMFPQDPLGRHGPRLDEFLMFPR